MVKAIINTYGNANKEAGWNSQEIQLGKESATIADVIGAAKLADGKTLSDLIVEGDWLKDSYAIFLSGRLLSHPVDLKMEINDGAELLILDFPFILGGG